MFPLDCMLGSGIFLKCIRAVRQRNTEEHNISLLSKCLLFNKTLHRAADKTTHSYQPLAAVQFKTDICELNSAPYISLNTVQFFTGIVKLTSCLMLMTNS